MNVQLRRRIAFLLEENKIAWAATFNAPIDVIMALPEAHSRYGTKSWITELKQKVLQKRKEVTAVILWGAVLCGFADLEEEHCFSTARLQAAQEYIFILFSKFGASHYHQIIVFCWFPFYLLLFQITSFVQRSAYRAIDILRNNNDHMLQVCFKMIHQLDSLSLISTFRRLARAKYKLRNNISGF